MNKLIIGCDPDVDGKGFAIYENGVLTELRKFSLIELYQYISILKNELHVELHIEDLHSNKATWQKGGSGAARKVGRCEQMQLEVERIAEYFDIKVVRYPVSSKWKKGDHQIKEFMTFTGWTKKANEDQRSAAYFGYLGVLAGQTTKHK